MDGPSQPNSCAMTRAMTGTGEEMEIERRGSALNRLRRLPRTIDGRFAPMAVVQASGTVFPKRLFMGATANGWVGWTANVSRS
jgi:hypothetical protein